VVTAKIHIVVKDETDAKIERACDIIEARKESIRRPFRYEIVDQAIDALLELIDLGELADELESENNKREKKETADGK